MIYRQTMNSQKNSERKDLAKNQINGFDKNQYYLDADPDLNTDVEILIPRASARSRTTMSAKSQKTAHSKASENDNIVRSRGRPIKPHEVWFQLYLWYFLLWMYAVNILFNHC